MCTRTVLPCYLQAYVGNAKLMYTYGTNTHTEIFRHKLALVVVGIMDDG